MSLGISAICDYCGKEIKKGDEYVLAGKYPSNWKIYVESRWAVLEKFGSLYHKACYRELLKKEESKQKEDAES